MALTITEHALQSSTDDTGTADFVMSAITTVSGSLLLMQVSAIDTTGSPGFMATKVTPSGGGLTFTLRQEIEGVNWGWGTKYYTATVTTGASTVFTIDPDDHSMAKIRVKCWSIEGYDTGSPVGGIAETVAAGNDGAQSTTLNATPAAGSMVFATRYALMNNGQATATEGAGWTETDDVSRTDYDALQIQTRTGSTSTTVAWVDVNTGAGTVFETALAAIEIKAAAGGGATANVTGVEGTGQVGTISANGAAISALAGVAATGGIGTLAATAVTATITLSGVGATGSIGALTASGPAVAVTFRTLINLTDEGGEVYAATSSGTSQGARGYTDPAILPSGTDGWIEASKGSGGDGAIVLTLDAAVPGNVAYGGGDFIGQVNTAGSLFYGVNTASLTAVPTYVLPESLLSLIRLRRSAGTVTFESSEDGGATWTVRNTFAGTSTAALVPRWYTTYSVTPRRIYRPRAYGLVDAIGNAIQGQWVAPNITATTDWIYVGTAGLAGQYYITRMSRSTLVGTTTTLSTDESDDHNVPAIIETNTGKIMVAYATHSLDEFVRSRLSATVDLDDWGSVRTLTTSDTATYMQVHRLAGVDRIWMLYRIGSSSAGDWVMRYSDDEGATWSTERILAQNTYIISVMDPDGVHIRCFAYEHPLVGSNHDIYYFRVNLSTGDVIDSEGTVYGNVVTDTGLPITEAEQHKAVDVTAPTTTRMYELGRVGVPQVLASEFTDENAGTYYRYVYDTDTGLFTRQAITTSGPAFFASTSDYFGGACFDSADTDIVYCSRNVGGAVGVGSWQLVRMVTADGGDSWTEDEILRTSTRIIARPQVRYGQLWWSEIPTYNDYTSFASSVHFTTLASGATHELTGVSATGAVGTLATSISATLTGVSAAGDAGNVTESHDSSVVLGGVSATGEAEAIAPPVNMTIEIVGVSGAGAVGTLTESHNSTVDLTGLAASGLAGTVEAFAGAVIVQLTGVQSTAALGTLDVSADANLLLAGVVGTSAIGELLAVTGVLQELTGVEASGSTGTLSVSGSVGTPIIGVAGSGAVGTLIVSFGAIVELPDVQAVGTAGSLAASIGFAPIAPAHRTLRVPARSRYIRV